jgi:hypothetical protein
MNVRTMTMLQLANAYEHPEDFVEFPINYKTAKKAAFNEILARHARGQNVRVIEMRAAKKTLVIQPTLSAMRGIITYNR